MIEKLGRVKVSNRLLEELLKGNWKLNVASTAPHDLNVRRVYQSEEGPCGFFYAIVESAAFPGVPEGQEIPLYDMFHYEV